MVFSWIGPNIDRGLTRTCLSSRHRGVICHYDFSEDALTQDHILPICRSNYAESSGYNYNISLTVPYDRLSASNHSYWCGRETELIWNQFDSPNGNLIIHVFCECRIHPHLSVFFKQLSRYLYWDRDGFMTTIDYFHLFSFQSVLINNIRL